MAGYRPEELVVTMAELDRDEQAKLLELAHKDFCTNYPDEPEDKALKWLEDSLADGSMRVLVYVDRVVMTLETELFYSIERSTLRSAAHAPSN